MLNGAFSLSSDARDLGLQRVDPRLQFLDREGIEILTRQRGDGIVGAFGQEIVLIHGDSVDPYRSPVNKALLVISTNGGD